MDSSGEGIELLRFRYIMPVNLRPPGWSNFSGRFDQIFGPLPLLFLRDPAHNGRHEVRRRCTLLPFGALTLGRIQFFLGMNFCMRHSDHLLP